MAKRQASDEQTGSGQTRSGQTRSGQTRSGRSGKGGFFIQAAVLTTIMILMFGGLLTLSDRASRFIPFKWEQTLSNAMTAMFPLGLTAGTDEISVAWTKDLQKLIDNLATEIDMPEDIEIHVNYSPRNIPNAAAVMGGEVYVFDGLIKIARSENALSFVLAHEIAHLKHRHGLRGLGRSGVVASAILILFGTSGDLSQVALESSHFSGLKYGRDMETQADEEAIDALARYYGHVGGMEQIFTDFLVMQKDLKMAPEILQTHPDLAKRLAHMNRFAREKGYALEGELTPMAFSMSRSNKSRTCTKSATLCRIEESLERIRKGRTSLVATDTTDEM